MRSVAESGCAGALRSFSLGIGCIRMAQAFYIMMGPGVSAPAGLCATRRVNSWILFATQFGTLVIMPGDEGREDHSENEFLQELPPPLRKHPR